MIRYITSGRNGIDGKIKIKMTKEECIATNSRPCTNCEKVKDFSEFHVHKAKTFGIAAQCKMCKRKGDPKPKKIIVPNIKTIEKALFLPLGKKRCPKCNEVKLFKDFIPKSKPVAEGNWPVNAYCRECDKQSRLNRIAAMTLNELEKYRKGRYKSVSQYTKDNPDKVKNIMKRYYEKARLDNKPSYLRALLYRKLYNHKELQREAKKNGFEPSEDLMLVAESLNNLNLKIESYG